MRLSDFFEIFITKNTNSCPCLFGGCTIFRKVTVSYPGNPSNMNHFSMQNLLDHNKNVADHINLKCKPRGTFKDMSPIGDNGRWSIKCPISF